MKIGRKKNIPEIYKTKEDGSKQAQSRKERTKKKKKGNRKTTKLSRKRTEEKTKPNLN